MNYRLIDDRDYSQGVVKDIAPHLLPPGSLPDALNMIFDQPGIARQRNGTTRLLTGAQTGFGTSLGWAYAQDANLLEELLAANGRDGNIYSVNKSTGAATLIRTVTTASMTYGRSARHFGYVVFPGTSGGATPRGMVYAAGQTSALTFTNVATASITTNNQQVTLSGADVTTNIKVGAIATISDSVAGKRYYGRVVSIDTTKIFTVSPKLDWTNAAIAIGSVQLVPAGMTFGGGCATSFQNRLLLGNTTDLESVNRTLVTDRRAYYSPLPNETVTVSNVTLYGATWLDSVEWPVDNFIESPGSDPIVAMEPVSDDELLLLTTGTPYVFRGTLATQTATASPGVTYDIWPLNTSAGCLSDHSVQRTPKGIIWASSEGIMVYTGSMRPPDDLTKGRMHQAWLRLTKGANFAVHGSAFVSGHYIVTGISAGTTFAWAVNLDTGAWAPLSGLDIFAATVRPSTPQQVFALRWWSQASAPPSFTNGQCVRWDSIFAPDVAGQTKADADGSTITLSATSRSMTDDLHTPRIARRIGVDYALEAASAAIAVTAGARIDSNDTAGTETVAIGSLSNTGVLNVSAASNATPITITTSAAHGLQTGDAVDIHGVLGNTAANGRYRIAVTSTTQFTLAQSRGSGAYTSGGDVKKITQSEFMASGMDIGQATFVKLDSAGTVNKFELHALRVGAMEIPRGMGR